MFVLVLLWDVHSQFVILGLNQLSACWYMCTRLWELETHVPCHAFVCKRLHGVRQVLFADMIETLQLLFPQDVITSQVMNLTADFPFLLFCSSFQIISNKLCYIQHKEWTFWARDVTLFVTHRDSPHVCIWSEWVWLWQNSPTTQTHEHVQRGHAKALGYGYMNSQCTFKPSTESFKSTSNVHIYYVYR